MAAAAVGLVVLAFTAPAQGATYKATKTQGGCKADLYATTSTIAPTDIPQAYAETQYVSGGKCVLGAYVKYTKFGSSNVVRQSSTDYDSYNANASGTIDSKLKSSAHFISYDAPAAVGRWFVLP